MFPSNGARGGNLPLIKQQNYILVKQTIYLDSPISRSEIAQKLSLTAPTITAIVNPMISAGMLREYTAVPDDNSRAIGRRPVMLEFVPGYALLLGVEAGPYHTSFVLADLQGKVLDAMSCPVAPEHYEEALTVLCQQITEFLARTDTPASRLLGIGFAMPGFVNTETGKVMHSIRPDWANRRIDQDLSARFQVRTVVENNVRARAVCSYYFDRQVLADPAAYFFVSRGTACPILVNGSILSGKAAGAGEIGHTVLEREGPVCEVCGNRGCLDALASQSAILKRCQAIMQANIHTLLREICPDPKQLTIDMVLQAQECEDHIANTVVNDCISYLGIAMANVTNFLSPRQILVDAHIMKLEQNRNALIKAAKAHTYVPEVRAPSLHFVPYDPLRGARGAAAVVLKRLLLENPEI